MNNESRSKKSIKNILSGMVFRIIGMVFPFIIKSILIRTLGIQYLGLNSLFASVLAILSLSELGVGSALVFSMYEPIATNDVRMVSALLNAYKKIYRIIGSIILVIGLSLTPFLEKLINGTYPTEVNIYILYFIYLLNTVLSYWLFSYKTSLLEASQKNGVESLLHTITNTVMYLGQIVALIFTHNYYAYLIVMPLCTLLLNIMRSLYVDKHYPEYKCEGNLDKSYMNIVFRKVRALIGHKIGTTIITSSDSIVISSFLGLDTLAIYSNYYMIINSLIGMITIFYTAITASVGNSLITDQTDKINKQFNVLNLLNSWIVGWCTVCLCVLYQPFMRLWMGEDLMFPYRVVALLSVYFYAWLIRRIGLTYKDAAGMWEQDFWKPYIGSVVNIVVNIALVITIGIEGVLISTILVMVAIYFPWETVIVGKNILKLSMRRYVGKIVTNGLLVIGSVISIELISSLMHFKVWGELIVRAILCCIIPNMIFLIAYFRTVEFSDVKSRVKHLLNHS